MRERERDKEQDKEVKKLRTEEEGKEGSSMAAVSHLFSEGAAGGADPVLGVAAGGRATQRQGGTGGVLGCQVPEEARGLQHPGPGAALKQHVLRGAQRHQGHRGWVHRLHRDKHTRSGSGTDKQYTISVTQQTHAVVISTQ